MIWSLDQHAGRLAVITEHGASLSYGALGEAADEFARQIGMRTLVFCLGTNDFASLVGYLGCLRNRLVPFLGAASLGRRHLARLRERYHPGYVWCPKAMAEELGDARPVFQAHGYVLLKAATAPGYPLHEDLALLLTTSGSTGSPKLVRLSYRNLQSNAASIADFLGIDGEDRAMTSLPMSYSYGLSVINSHLLVGGTLILTNSSLMQRGFWDRFRALQVTSFAGVPYGYEMLARLGFFSMELPALRSMTQAGGRLDRDLQVRFAKYAAEQGLSFFVMYGQTEATARMAYLPPAEAMRRRGSIGRAIPGGQLYLVGTDGRRIEQVETVGELTYEGENVMLGYAEQGSDLAKGDEQRGVLRTGDLARRDDDGYFYVVGRIKRFLKIFGTRVNLDEVESTLRVGFSSLDCACGGRDDRLLVYAVEPFDAEQVRKFLVSELRIHAAAVEVRTVARIPRSEAGKVLYEDLAGVSERPLEE